MRGQGYFEVLLNLRDLDLGVSEEGKVKADERERERGW